MLATKERHFASHIHVSLDELVPHDHFYRHLDRTLDLSFVREFVHNTYAVGGRPSIDPIVFFKLQLVLFFEGIRYNEARHGWIEHLGAQDRRVSSRGYHRMADLRVSTTDPDATLMPTKDGADMGYRTRADLSLHSLARSRPQD